jgi:O-antigen ligase
MAAAVLLGLVVIGAFVTKERLRAWVVCCAAMILLSFGVTALLGWTSDDRGAAVGGNRANLWRDSVNLLTENPVTGVGPGRFKTESPTAASDRDLRWAHSVFLQSGAEFGIVGLVLALCLAMWPLARLATLPWSPAVAIAVGAVAALLVHACIDYVMRFPEVPLATAALVGYAIASSETVRFTTRVGRR